MERFVKRHESRILGMVSGFDRILFRGNLPTICHLEGMKVFLSSQHILYKDFGRFALKISDGLKQRAEQIAPEAGRPFLYEPSSKKSKEETVLQMARKDKVTEGLICVLSWVEPCQSFGIRRDRASKNSFGGSATQVFAPVLLLSRP